VFRQPVHVLVGNARTERPAAITATQAVDFGTVSIMQGVDLHIHLFDAFFILFEVSDPKWFLFLRFFV
jgi:hypothetical protein